MVTGGSTHAMETLLRSLSMDGIAAGEEDEAVGVRRDVDIVDVARKAYEALQRKGWSPALCEAALTATEASCAGDGGESFNEQRKRRLARALEHLVLTTPLEQQPAEYRSSGAGGKAGAPSGRLAKKAAASEAADAPASLPASASMQRLQEAAAADPLSLVDLDDAVQAAGELGELAEAGGAVDGEDGEDEGLDIDEAAKSLYLEPRGPKGPRFRSKEEVASLRAQAAAEGERLRKEREAAHEAEDEAEAAAHLARMLAAASQAEARAQRGGAEQQAVSARLRSGLDAYVSSEAARPMLAVRSSLPAAAARDALVAAISRFQVTLVVGATGSGKTTQVPQYILDDAILRGAGASVKMVVTQPRRVAATSVATRVAAERGEKLGLTVGYKIRQEAVGGDARILFATTGVLLRRLNDDPALAGVSHVLVDEAHERSLDNDLLLTLLRDILPLRPSLKLVLMSATMDADVFSSYFSLPREAVLFVPGVTHPVQERFLEDIVALTGYTPPQGSSELSRGSSRGSGAPSPAIESEALRKAGYPDAVARLVPTLSQDAVNYNLLGAVLNQICSDKAQPPGGILVFLPGLMEIQQAREAALQQPGVRSATDNGRYLSALHSQLGSAEQAQAFAPVPAGFRKLVLATNIAETSVTIEDVVHVVDAGKLKETGYDIGTGMPTLLEAWVSKASAQQRRGRAGRVRPGVCWRLYSRATHAGFAAFALPEIQRVPLIGALLSATSLRSGGPGGATALLAKAPSPPAPATLAAAAATLVHLGAMDTRLRLTALGRRLAALPLDPRVGKMLVFACLLRCVGPALTVAAVFGGRSLFVAPLDKREEANAAKAAFAGDGCSDHIAAVRAFDGWLAAKKEGRSAEERYIRESYLSRRGLMEVADSRRQCAGLLVEAGLLGGSTGGRRNGRGGGGGGGASQEERDHGVDAAAWSLANENAGDMRVLAALLVAGLAPNIARVEPAAKPGSPAKLFIRLPPDDGDAAPPQKRGGKAQPVKAAREAPCQLHPGCVAHGRKLPSRHVVYLEAVRSSSIFLRDCTPVTPYALLLFGGELRVRGDGVTVDGWATFKAPPRIAVLLGALRTRLNGLLLSRVATPQADLETAAVLKALKALLAAE